MSLVGAVIVSVIITIVGDYCLKLGSLQNNTYSSPWTFIGAGLYASTAFIWVYLMKKTNLTVIASLYTSTTLILLILLGLFIFKEDVTTRQLVGAGLALIAIFVTTIR